MPFLHKQFKYNFPNDFTEITKDNLYIYLIQIQMRFSAVDYQQDITVK